MLYLLDGQWHGAHALASSQFLALLALIDGLRSLYAGYALPEGLSDQALAAGEAHYAALAARLGTPVAVPAEALNEIGYRLLEGERTAEAIAVFERAARENPSSANAWDSLADALEKVPRRADALRVVQRAVELSVRFELPDRASYERHLAKLRQEASAAVAPAD